MTSFTQIYTITPDGFAPEGPQGWLFGYNERYPKLELGNCFADIRTENTIRAEKQVRNLT